LKSDTSDSPLTAVGTRAVSPGACGCAVMLPGM
jgi:hypothetical protein